LLPTDTDLENSFVIVNNDISSLIDSFVLVGNSVPEDTWGEWMASGPEEPNYRTHWEEWPDENPWTPKDILAEFSASTISTNNLEEVSPKNYRIENKQGVPYFFVDEYFAEGNYGLAYFCHDAFGQEYVLKCLKTIRDEEYIKADWEKEKEMLYSLSHPNIINLYDAFFHDKYYYLVMEKADGNLRDYISQVGKLPNNKVIEIGGQILSAVNHIHSKNILHRDLHVDNILYSFDKSSGNDAQPAIERKIITKISDFGISKQLREEDMASSFIGRNYDYAPELLTEECTTKLSDLYQVGLILYFCMTGKAAISEEDGCVADVTTSGLAADRAYDEQTPLGNMIGRLLNVEPSERFKNCIETWVALQKCKN